MRTQRFEYNGATITVREQLGIDALDAYALHRELVQRIAAEHKIEADAVLDSIHWNRITTYTEIVLLTQKVDGQLSVDLPPKDAPFDQIYAGYKVFLDAPYDLLQQYSNALREINRKAPDPNS